MIVKSWLVIFTQLIPGLFHHHVLISAQDQHQLSETCSSYGGMDCNAFIGACRYGPMGGLTMDPHADWPGWRLDTCCRRVRGWESLK